MRLQKSHVWNYSNLPQAKFHGTPVTMETFLEWKRRFEEELRGGTGSKETSQQPPRLTGTDSE